VSNQDFPVGPNEGKRIDVLKEMRILDSFEEASFNEITEMTSYIFGVPTVTISLVDETRQWFKSHYGLDACETDRDIAFCNFTVMSDNILEVTDPLSDERFNDNPLVVGELHLRYYCGAPIIIKGQTIGAFCLIDYENRLPLTEQQRTIFQGLANIVARTINQRHLIMKSAAMLSDVMRERWNSED